MQGLKISSDENKDLYNKLCSDFEIFDEENSDSGDSSAQNEKI